MSLLDHCIIPDWPAPANIKTLQTTRHGGVSNAPYDTLNLGDHVGDAGQAVARNRQLLEPLLPSEPVWLEQVHGTVVANADMASCLPQADACIARHRDTVCVVMTADCLPILLCDKQGSVVGVVHAGWKGLAAGVVEAAVSAMEASSNDLMAWLGPAISQRHFEVGGEVRAAFVDADTMAANAFIPSLALTGTLSHKGRVNTTPSPSTGEGRGEGEKYLADLYLLARMRLNAMGITQIYGGEYCTYRENDKFFSYRRDRATGRMGTFIWIE